jgi:hypothetical protein
MTLQNKIRVDVFLSTFILLITTAVAGFLLAFSKYEGALGPGILVNAIADYILYLFPLILLAEQLSQITPFAFLLLTMSNIIIYSCLSVWFLGKILLRARHYRPFSLTYYTVVTILSLLLLRVFIAIITSD